MTRSSQGLENTVYKVEVWAVEDPEDIYTQGPYATLGAARGSRTSTVNSWSRYYGACEGRVLELTGEWVEVA